MQYSQEHLKTIVRVETPYSTLSVGPTIPQSLATLTAVNMLSPDYKTQQQVYSPLPFCTDQCYRLK